MGRDEFDEETEKESVSSIGKKERLKRKRRKMRKRGKGRKRVGRFELWMIEVVTQENVNIGNSILRDEIA